ncbi:hypothetical protein M422DRAFT_273669 [Sphaerobolus stellatus SS14]|uniref:Uncharacterized protein n=1 Tax=Sphaerobolus stellatus (strain SS14) TaxID=990650 RepID=A0A0C9T8P6_SPHS4|nr:hypothetical protein M422DRAFT_273669 [Sphaerobolus stellatus SS14]
MSEVAPSAGTQELPAVLPEGRRIIEGGIHKKSVDELLVLTRLPFNEPLWPVKKGNDSLKLKKKPTFKQLVDNLLDDNLGMKVALPLPSPTVQAEAASHWSNALLS